MRTTVTQNNLHILLPSIVCQTVGIIAKKEKQQILSILPKFYKSKTYKLLEREDCKFWHLGAVALYENFKEEINN